MPAIIAPMVPNLITMQHNSKRCALGSRIVQEKRSREGVIVFLVFFFYFGSLMNCVSNSEFLSLESSDDFPPHFQGILFLSYLNFTRCMLFPGRVSCFTFTRRTCSRRRRLRRRPFARGGRQRKGFNSPHGIPWNRARSLFLQTFLPFLLHSTI